MSSTKIVRLPVRTAGECSGKMVPLSRVQALSAKNRAQRQEIEALQTTLGELRSVATDALAQYRGTISNPACDFSCNRPQFVLALTLLTGDTRQHLKNLPGGHPDKPRADHRAKLVFPANHRRSGEQKTPMKRGGIANSMSQQTYAVRPAFKGDSFQYALVKDGAVVFSRDAHGNPPAAVVAGPSADKPEGYSTFHPVGCEWIRIAGNADSEPFDPAKHYRGDPSLVVQGDEVIRLYPLQARGTE